MSSDFIMGVSSKIKLDARSRTQGSQELLPHERELEQMKQMSVSNCKTRHTLTVIFSSLKKGIGSTSPDGGKKSSERTYGVCAFDRVTSNASPADR